MITTNTDGDPISQAFAAAMAEPSVMYSMKLYRNGTDLGAVIKRAKLDLGAGQLSDDLGTFAACGVYQTQFSASLYDCPSILGDELEVRVGVMAGNAYEYVAVAYVTITEESVWKGVADVRGVGRMGLMHAPHGLAEGDYQPAAVASAIYAATGILVSIDARLTTQSVHADAGGTCRDALESMCARLGAFACELGEGVSVMPYSSTATGTIPTGHVTGKPELGALYEVDGITVEAGEESFVQGTGRVHIVDGTATATTAAATWGNMRGYAFTPATLNIALIDPRWTVADTLSVTLGEDAYTIPARGISITYDGGYFGTVSAAGLTAEAEEIAVEGPLTRSVGYARSIADEALEVAQATGQHFWHDDAGAHVSTEALNPTGPSNSLWNSLGLLIRKAMNNLVSITQSAIAFFDGSGNDASNITASFGSSGFQVGQDDGSHLLGDFHSLQLADKEGSTYFYVSDLRDSEGIAAIVDSYVGDGSTTQFSLSLTATSTGYTVEVNGSAVTSGITKTTSSVTFSTAPAKGNAVSISYETESQGAKAYTLGVRGSGNVGARSTVVGTGTASGGSSFSANSGKANGRLSSAFGNSTAAGDTSHAEGELTQANARGSHSEGLNSRANGQFSHAEGYQTIASGQYQHVFGKNNREDSAGTYVEIVGNGQSDSVRLNARTLDWDGNEVLAGTSTADSHNGFAGRATLASTDSIDTLYRTGIYYVSGSGAQGTHPPFGSSYYSIISMGSGSETSSAWVGKQVAVGGAGDVATRTYTGSPRAWSAWEQLASIPVPVDEGGTGATTAADARANLLAVGYQSGMNAAIANFTGTNQLWGLRAKVINTNSSLNGDTVYILLRDNGISAYDTTASSYPWQLTLPSGTTDLTVNVGTPTLNSNATATTFETRRQGSVVNLQVYQLKVAASLADGSSVSLGTGIIGSNARPAHNVYMPLMANVSGKGAGVFLYITTAGNVTLYNRSGSSLSTGTNLSGNTSWVV